MAARHEAFLALYADAYPTVARYCWRLVGDEESAHDLAQEAFTRLFARWVSVREPRPYLFLVATNLAKASWRQRSNGAEAFAALVANHLDPVAVSHEESLVVRDAVTALPDNLRRVVLLHYFADLSVAQVAAVLHRPEGTVKRQLSEARAVLAQSMGGRR